MKETYRNVDYKSLFEMTGDPFVDAGGFALEEFASHFPDLDILEMIVKATNIKSGKTKCNAFVKRNVIILCKTKCIKIETHT